MRSRLRPSTAPVLHEMSLNTTTTTFLASRDADFQSLVARPVALPLLPHIPKVVHFVFSKLTELTWLQYAVIRCAFVHLGAEKVKVWIPLRTKRLPGEIWAQLNSMERVEIVRITMPDTVWGKKVQHIEHQSDLARVKILFEEGGIYLDTDVLPLKSADEIIFDPTTKATVMAQQNPRYDHVVSNAMIMSKPGSPFIRRWMERYKDFDPSEWDATSCKAPLEMADGGDPDLTIVGYRHRSWMYPMSGGRDVGPDPHLATMWLGKSWYDINKSFGVHLWKFDGGRLPRPIVVTPDSARNIDTPLFCKLRRAFDDLDRDGYRSVPWEEDPNCWPSFVKDLKEDQWRLFGDWRMHTDENNIKWVDSSGYRNHGFALAGTNTTKDPDTGVISRRFHGGDHAWLPVPADWDSRVGTVRMVFSLDEHAWLEGAGEIGLFKIRIDYGGEIVVSLTSEDVFDTPSLRFDWRGSFMSDDRYKDLDKVSWKTSQGFNITAKLQNDLSIAFDRRTRGTIAIYLNGEKITDDNLKLIPSPKIGNEVWLNAREWKNLDTGFRGNIYGLKMYADFVPASELMGASNVTTLPSHTHSLNVPVVLGLSLSLIGACWMWRIRITKGFIFDVKTMLRDWVGHVWKLIRVENAAYDRLRALSEEDVGEKDP